MGFLTALIYIVLSIIASILCVGLSLDMFDIPSLLNALETNIFADFSLKIIFLLTGTIITLLCLRYIQQIFLKSHRNKSISFKSPQGKVSITIFAIEDMLKKMLEERQEISHAKPRVCLKKKKIVVSTKGILVAEVNLVEFTKEIQENIKEKINTLLGEDKQVEVNLEIKKVSLGNKKQILEKEEPKVPFRNYT